MTSHSVEVDHFATELQRRADQLGSIVDRSSAAAYYEAAYFLVHVTMRALRVAIASARLNRERASYLAYWTELQLINHIVWRRLGFDPAQWSDLDFEAKKNLTASATRRLLASQER